ncbi:alpha/beta fold hydrolase [Nocardia concava]|uniref:alpha/beta fold hydrolase n=1 Tax=Nocardia concava TaxID=257281 RepID=UPI0002F3524F|nr:alpha/beta hydrolase [Nocardia concava]
MSNDSTAPARLTPPIGGFQMIDDRRVFVNRAGRGGPAVVFLPGASAVGLDYYGVQQGVSQFTTAVLYDRGGTGYSDPMALPRTATEVATELRALLDAENIPAPYVLAAHSLGGLYAHRFTQLFPADVAGLVWLDGLHRDWDEFVPPRASLAATEHMGPDPEELARMRPALHDIHAELLATYPPHLREALLEAKLTEEWLRTGVAERRTLIPLAAELRTGPAIPDVPVIALTVTGDDPDHRELHEAKTRMDAALADSVSHGEQRVLTDTFHHRLCFDRPDAVVAAIRDVVDRAARP